MSKEHSNGHEDTRPVSVAASKSFRRALQPTYYASVGNMYAIATNQNIYPEPTDDSWYHSMRAYADSQAQPGLTAALGQGASQAEVQHQPQSVESTPVRGDDETSAPTWLADLDSRRPDLPQSQPPIYQQSPLGTAESNSAVEAAQSMVDQEFAKVMAASRAQQQSPEYN